MATIELSTKVILLRELTKNAYSDSLHDAGAKSNFFAKRIKKLKILENFFFLQGPVCEIPSTYVDLSGINKK